MSKIIGISALIIVLFIGWFFLIKNKNEVLVNNNTNSQINQQDDTGNDFRTKFDGFSFSLEYPGHWFRDDFSTSNSKNIILDPIQTYSPDITVDMPLGLVTIVNQTDHSNSIVGGYADFPTVQIGKDGLITAKLFEKYYSMNAPEVSAQGKHEITYYIGEHEEISYSGSYNDKYLADFNSIINSLTKK